LAEFITCQFGNQTLSGFSILYSTAKTTLLLHNTHCSNKENIMIIQDLAYLEVATQEIEGGFNLGKDYSSIYFNEVFKIKKDVVSKVKVVGNLATAEADAYGKDSLTQTFATVYPWSSNSVSIAATN
jgi:hypothetical protein